MRNPNKVTTVISTSTDYTVIEFEYTSASVAQHDFSAIQKTYDGSRVNILGKVVTVTIDNEKMMTYEM